MPRRYHLRVLAPVLFAILACVGRAPVTIVAFGDSTTAPRPELRLPYADRLRMGLAALGVEANVVNAGVAGNTTTQALARIDRDVIERHPAVAILQFGLNDSAVDVRLGRTEPRVPQSLYEWNLRAMVRRLRAAGIEPILVTPNPGIWTERLIETYGQPPYRVEDKWGFNLYNVHYADSVRKIAKEADVPLIDAYRMYEAQDRTPAGVEGWLPDGLHPNDEACQALAEVAVRRVQEVLRDAADAPAGARTPLIAFGSPVRVDAPGWHASPDGLTGTGAGNRALGSVSLGDGDFRIRATLRMQGQQNSAAGFVFDENTFGFEGAKGTLFTNGPAFGGLRLLQPSVEVFEPGSWIRFEAKRTDGLLRFSINDRAVAEVSIQGAVGTFGFDPFRSSMTVLWFDVQGQTQPRREQPSMPRAYTIPTLDLSGDKTRQVVVDREEGQYLGHPTTVLLDDGKTMLTVYPKGHGRGAVVYKRSTDGGLTWSERLPTPANWVDSQEVPTLFRTIDPRSGKKRLVMFSGLYPIKRAVSEDEGLTWSPLEKVGDWGGIVAMGSMERLKNGDYAAWFHDDGRFFAGGGKTSGRFTLYQTLSHDGGLTWDAPTTIWSGSDVDLCEPGVVRSPDGRQIALLLRENSRKRNSHVMFSDDEAATWTAPRELPASLTGDRHTARSTPDGRLFVSFRDTTLESPTAGDWVAWVGTYDDIVQGHEGQYRVRLMDNQDGGDCAYPGVELLPDGTLVTTTYGHWDAGKPPYIVSVRLRLSELDALAKRGEFLSSGIATQTLFARGMNGVFEYRIPALAATASGTLVAVADARVDRAGDLSNNIDIAMRRSLDGGATWTPIERIVDHPGTEGAGDSQLTFDRDTNTLWLAYTYGSRGVGWQTSKAGFNSTDTLQIVLRKSEDDGATWSGPINVTTQVKKRGWTAMWTAPGNGLQLASGRLLFPVSVADENGHVQSRALISDDHGRTWRCSGAIAYGTNESQLYETAPDIVVANLRSDHGLYRRAEADSYDGGQSWREFVHVPELTDPGCQASVLQLRANGLLVFANPCSTRRENLSVRLGDDKGATWGLPHTVHRGPSAYSCMARLPDGSIGLLYEAGEKDPYEGIRFAKIPLAWLR